MAVGRTESSAEGRRVAQELGKHRLGGGAPGTPVVQRAASQASIAQGAT